VVDVYPRPRRTFVQKWLGGVFDEPSDDDSRLPGMTDLAHWYRIAAFPAGAMLALMPYTIRIQ
jgi:hypothetical protein